MPRPRRETRAGQLRCRTCGLWLHHSRFRSTQDNRRNSHGTVTVFRAECRTCEQTRRTDEKNLDRASALVESRAAQRARYLGVTLEFMLEDMNWKSLIPIVRAALEYPDFLCPNCGHPPLHERDTQIEHRAPPRPGQRPDFAREHARNIAISCGSCNNTKNNKDYEPHLDAMEDARLSVAAYYANHELGNGWEVDRATGTPSLFG